MKTLKENDATADKDAGATGTTFGAAGGALIGGVAGSLAGPAGTVAGALAGAVAGGIIGKAVGAGGWAENEDYWRDHFHEQSFYKEGSDYKDYADAFRFGHDRYPGSSGSFEENEPFLREEWENMKGSLPWEEARDAARAAWQRRHLGAD